MVPSVEQVQETYLYTRKEAAKRLKVSIRSIDNLYASGQLRGCRGGLDGGRVLFTEKSIREYIAKQERKG